jgi:hypothetical protein
MRQAPSDPKNKKEEEYGSGEFRMAAYMCSLLEDALDISLMRTELMRFEVCMTIRNKDFQFLDPMDIYARACLFSLRRNIRGFKPRNNFREI